MEYRQLGKTGEMIPALGIGTWKLGRSESDMDAIRVGIDAGMRFIDTAEMYANEEAVGTAIKGKKGVFVATKVSPDNFRYEGILKSCNASLKKLGRKQIDLYQLHWPNSRVPIAETMKAMEKLVDDGKIRYIGVSNFSIEEMTAAQEAMKRYEIASNQVEYSIITRQIEGDTLGFCRDVGSTVIAYSPFGNGKLFEKRYKGLLSTLDQIGIKYGKSASQVALNWVIAHKGVVAIPKASTKEHMLENAETTDFSLNEDERKRISKALFEYPENKPIAGSFGPIIKRNSSLVSRVMRYREAIRGAVPTLRHKKSG